jgi:hypothetical protein
MVTWRGLGGWRYSGRGGLVVAAWSHAAFMRWWPLAGVQGEVYLSSRAVFAWCGGDGVVAASGIRGVCRPATSRAGSVRLHAGMVSMRLPRKSAK